jgi:hypothetical protein
MDLREQIEVAQRSRFQKCLVCTCAQSYQCQPCDRALMTTKSTQAAGTTS